MLTTTKMNHYQFTEDATEYFDDAQNQQFPYTDNLTDDEAETINKLERLKMTSDEHFRNLASGNIVIDNYLPEWSSEEDVMLDIEDKAHPEKYLQFITDEKMIFEMNYMSKFVNDDHCYERNYDADGEIIYDNFDGDEDEIDDILIKRSRQFATK